MNVHYSVENHVASITFDHGRLNTLTPAMHRQLHDILVEFLADPSVHCGVLSGAGGRSFCAGDDLKSHLPEPDSTLDQVMEWITPSNRRAGKGDSWRWAHETMQMDRFKPVVAAVRGWCLGGGFGALLRLSDIRLASPDAKFGFPEIAYGMGGAGGLTQLTRLMPRTAAMSMLLEGEFMGAEEARRSHLVNEVVDSELLDERALAIARAIASRPPLSIRLAMESAKTAERMTSRQATHYSALMQQLERLASGESRPGNDGARDVHDSN